MGWVAFLKPGSSNPTPGFVFNFVGFAIVCPAAWRFLMLSKPGRERDSSSRLMVLGLAFLLMAVRAFLTAGRLCAACPQHGMANVA